MRAVQVWVAGAAVAISALAGCAGGDPTTSSTAASTPEAPPRGAEFLKPGLRLSEGAAEAYLKALAEVDHRLADDASALGHGLDICREILLDKTDAQVAENAATRFNVDDATATAIVEVTRSHLCEP